MRRSAGGQCGEHLGRTPPEGHEVNPRWLSRFRLAYVVSFESKMSSWGPARCAVPIGDELENRVVLFRFPQLPMDVAEHPGVGIMGQKGQHALLAAATFGHIMLLDEGILAVEGDRMEVEIEGVPMGQANVLRPRATGA